MPNQPRKKEPRDPERISPKNPNGRIDPPEKEAETTREEFTSALKKVARKVKECK
ncbi:MAG: hypothetical protein JSS66_13480 [Armatimonadetes bacterium]|nr:hypothetical protein [Armatimonadota bacterium]